MGPWAATLGWGLACPPPSTQPASQSSGESILGLESVQPYKVLQTGRQEAPVRGRDGVDRAIGDERSGLSEGMVANEGEQAQ